MNEEPYKSIDVGVFNEILSTQLCAEKNSDTKSEDLVRIIMQLNKLEKFIPEMKLEKRREFAKIDWKAYGFKSKADIKVDATIDVINTGSVLLFIPKKIYELEDAFEIPTAPTEKANNLTVLLADSFERLKVKAEHVIHECESDQISVYAQKNISEATRIHFKIRQRLKKIVAIGNNEDIYILYIQGLFIAQVMHYFLKFFEEFYKGKDYSHLKMKSELLDIINGYSNMFQEPQAEYKTGKKTE